MIIAIAGEPRTWTPVDLRITECTCGNRSLTRTANGWHCTTCNETYDEEPWFPAIDCSKHGQQVQYNNGEGTYWCIDCEEDDFAFTARASKPRMTDKKPRKEATTPHRITTSIKIDDDLWRDVKHHCGERKLTIAEYLEHLIRQELAIDADQQAPAQHHAKIARDR